MKYKKSTDTLHQDWQDRLKKDVGLTDKELKKLFLVNWSWKKMEHIFRQVWWDIFAYVKEQKLTLRNLVAITGKDTRKTTVFIIFLWFLMVEYPWLNGFLMRDTILKSQTQMNQQLKKAVGIITNEYKVENFNKKVLEQQNGFYLIRDKRSKSNQKIELMSFDSIVELGGFTTNNAAPAVFIYDELQNPRSSLKPILNSRQFMANYKFIDTKNNAAEISTGLKLPNWIPRHYFLSNRYVASHPLNLFAEEHFPYFDYEKDEELITGARTWMLEDPLNNNFIAKYFGKEDMKPGWEEFWGTMIIYGSKLSNELLRADKEWEEKQIELINRGDADDLAIVIGDLFEGYHDDIKCYQYTRRDTITETEFINKYAPFVNQVRISVDLDFSRQIVIGAHYDAMKTWDNSATDFVSYRTIRDKKIKIKCDGLSADGAKTEIYHNLIHKQLLLYIERIKKMMPQITICRLMFDEKTAHISGRFNFGIFKNPFWKATKITFDKRWPIRDRPGLIDQMQDTGFVLDIAHPSLEELHNIAKSAIIETTTRKGKQQRLEKSGDTGIDILNQDEYGLYDARIKLIVNNANKNKLVEYGIKSEW